MRTIRNILTLLLMIPILAIFASGCHTFSKSQSLHASTSKKETLKVAKGSGKDHSRISQPVENEATTPYQMDSAKLRPGLVINVTVLVGGKNEITATSKRITDQGTIAMPLLGTVMAGDQTLENFSALLTTSYKEFYVDPQVIVEFVRDDNKEGLSPWGSVTVLGRVKKSGRISLPATRDMTLSGAIQQAGGYDTSAKESAIRITRKRPDGTVKTWEVDLHSVGAEGMIENDILLEPDDVVFVPELIF
jgi:protein involved in polysaccharide export with SLBB domain